jgi:hypothetical protein
MLLPYLLLAFAAELSPETAPALKLAWTHHTNATPPNARAAEIAAFEGSPVLAGNFLYVITPFNQVLALIAGPARSFGALIRTCRTGTTRKRRRAGWRWIMGG